MGNPPQAQGQGNVVIGNVQNLNYGSNIGGDQTSSVSHSSTYQTTMSKHGVVYWLLHLLVAFAAATLCEILILHFLR